MKVIPTLWQVRQGTLYFRLCQGGSSPRTARDFIDKILLFEEMNQRFTKPVIFGNGIERCSQRVSRDLLARCVEETSILEFL